MIPVYDRHGVTVHQGDCLDVLATLPDASVHAVVTDPPYELAFMGRSWDASGVAFNPALWGECLRVLKPGGHLLAFGGTRTWHRLTCAIEDAGFEIRDSIAWLYGSGFPKSHDVGKAIDRAAGAERPVVGVNPNHRPASGVEYAGIYTGGNTGSAQITVPATDAARQWQGWGTALKPAHEPIVVARKPLAGTVAANVLEHGTGALNIDGCRVVATDKAKFPAGYSKATGAAYAQDEYSKSWTAGEDTNPGARWPSNVVFTHSADCAERCVAGCPVAELDGQSGTLTSGANPTRRSSDKFRDAYGDFTGQERCTPARGADRGGASRFFPVFRWEAKAPPSERPNVNGAAHPTVKPLALMRWLLRLVTPPGGTVLDPFLGSGTTAQAARAEGFQCIGIERDETYLPLIRARLSGRPQQAEPVRSVNTANEPLDLLDLLTEGGDAA